MLLSKRSLVMTLWAAAFAAGAGFAASIQGCGGGGGGSLVCNDPVAQGCVCTPGQSGCVGNTYSICNDDGKGYTAQTQCGTGANPSKVCVVDRGCLPCFPNLTRCRGFDVTRCAADGFGEAVVETCSASLGETCLDGECKNACEVAAQNKSYQGCEYFAVDLDNAGLSDTLNAAGQQFSVVVSNPSPLPADVVVEQNDAMPGAIPQPTVVKTVRLEPGDLRVIDLPQREIDGSTPGLVDDGPGTFLSSAAYRIRSSAPIVAYQFNPLENVNVFSNDASLLIPTAALDKTYMVMGWPQTIADTDVPETDFEENLRATLTIVGVREGITTVSIRAKTATIAGRTMAGEPIPVRLRGETWEAKLGPFDVLNLETGDFNADFTGSTITADQPVAVFSGSEASDVPDFQTLSSRQCCADHMEEQLFPLTTAGKRFVAVKSAERTQAVKRAGADVAVVREKEWFRVLGTEEFTTVNTSLPAPNDRFTVTAGNYRTLEVDRDFVISATAPVIVAQFNGSQATTGIPNSLPGGDPSFTLLPPVEQYRTDYNFLVPNKYAFDFLLIAAPVDTAITYDGGPLPPECSKESAGTVTVDGKEVEFEATRCPLSAPMILTGPSAPPAPKNVLPGAQDDGAHTLSGDKPFGLIVYGFDSFVSYGYPGGADLRAINVK